MDELAKHNKNRWEALARARVAYSRPFLNLSQTEAQQWLDNQSFFSLSGIGQVLNKDILCLAGGGGQQTAVFGLLGANVTVLDLTETQLERDKQAAAQHGYPLRIEQGDMRDLSRFANNSFDIIWQPYSINFVPDAETVIREVGRAIRPGGYYHLDFSNPFWSMDENDWLPQGYPVKQPYITGSQLQYSDPNWTFTNDLDVEQTIEGPREFLHALGTIMNSLVQSGFIMLGLKEWPVGDPSAEPGTWEHLLTIIPPFLTIGSIYRQDFLANLS